MKDRIKKIRKKLNLTQQEFADRLGIKRGGVANYELGRNEPANSVISLICREFNINEYWLRTGYGDMFINKTRDEEIAEFISSISESDDSFKKRFVLMLSSLSESEWEVLEKMALKLYEGKTSDQKSRVLPLNAAHARTDIEVTQDMIDHDEAIMDDDNF